MSFVGVYRDFASFPMKAATSVTALATRRSTFGVIGSWFLGFQADPTPPLMVVTFGIPTFSSSKFSRQRINARKKLQSNSICHILWRNYVGQVCLTDLSCFILSLSIWTKEWLWESPSDALFWWNCVFAAGISTMFSQGFLQTLMFGVTSPPGQLQGLQLFCGTWAWWLRKLPVGPECWFEQRLGMSLEEWMTPWMAHRNSWSFCHSQEFAIPIARWPFQAHFFFMHASCILVRKLCDFSHANAIYTDLIYFKKTARIISIDR